MLLTHIFMLYLDILQYLTLHDLINIMKIQMMFSCVIPTKENEDENELDVTFPQESHFCRQL